MHSLPATLKGTPETRTAPLIIYLLFFHRMDSYVLAETFKYLFLLFSEQEDLLLDMDDFVFNTEAHIFPLSLANINSTLNQIIQDTVSQSFATGHQSVFEGQVARLHDC